MCTGSAGERDEAPVLAGQRVPRYGGGGPDGDQGVGEAGGAQVVADRGGEGGGVEGAGGDDVDAEAAGRLVDLVFGDGRAVDQCGAHGERVHGEGAAVGFVMEAVVGAAFHTRSEVATRVLRVAGEAVGELVAGERLGLGVAVGGQG